MVREYAHFNVYLKRLSNQHICIIMISRFLGSNLSDLGIIASASQGVASASQGVASASTGCGISLTGCGISLTGVASASQGVASASQGVASASQGVASVSGCGIIYMVLGIVLKMGVFSHCDITMLF